MKKRIFLAVILAVFTLGVITSCGFVDDFKNDEEITEKAVKRDRDKRKSKKKSEDVTILVFQAQTNNPTDDEMDVVETVFETRLSNAGYTEARISKGEGGKIAVKIPKITDTDEVKNLLGRAAKLTFKNADGEEIINSLDIKDAEYEFSKTSENSPKQPYVQIEFTAEGRKKFAAATEAAAAQASTGRNYISIMLDDTIVSSPSVSERIDSDTCIISGNFTKEEAMLLANQIKSGQLPFNLELISSDIQH